MDPILDEFEAFAGQFEFKAPETPIVSNLTGHIEEGAVFDANYWRRHIRSPVRFEESVVQLAEENTEVLIEMGPTSSLLGMARRCVSEWKPVAVPSLRKEQSGSQVLFDAVSEVYTHGVLPDWKAFDAHRNLKSMEIPGYPLDLQRYWFEPDEATTHIRDFVYGASHITPILGRKASIAGQVVFENTLTSFSPRYLQDHVVTGTVLLPGSAYVEMALGAATAVFGEGTHSVENLSFKKGMFLSEKDRSVQLHISGNSGKRRSFEVFSRPVKSETDKPWDLNATGTIVSADSVCPSPVDIADVQSRQDLLVSREEFYSLVSKRGLDYGPAFQVQDNLQRCGHEAISQLRADATVFEELGKYTIHPAIGDGCLQAMTGVVPLEQDGSFCPDLYLPMLFITSGVFLRIVVRHQMLSKQIF